MIYVISKATFGSYNVRDIQCNANWDCCPYSDYALIPNNLVEGILATQGYCDITLNSAGNEVTAFTARTIPSVPEECCGTNTVLSVNGVTADEDGEVTLPPSIIGSNKVFGKLTDIGITAFPTTMKTVVQAMPNRSTLILDSREIISGGANEISDLGLSYSGVYMFMKGYSNSRLAIFHVYSTENGATAYMTCGAYSYGTNAVTWLRGDRPSSVNPNGRWRYSVEGKEEWINPLMEIGKEYRTIEHFNNKPVYCKLVNFGTAPNNTTKTVAHTATNARVIDMGGYIMKPNGDLLTLPWHNAAMLSATNTDISIETKADYSAYTAYVWIKYYKTTD